MASEAPVADALHAAAREIALRLDVPLCDDCGMPSPHHLDVCVYVRRQLERLIRKARGG